jgi:hypothetical protein
MHWSNLMRSATMEEKQSDTRYGRLVESLELERYAQTFIEKCRMTGHR